MRSLHLLTGVLIVAMAAAGCGTRPEDVPGSVRPGNVEQTANASEGFASGSSAYANGYQPIGDLSVSPLPGGVKPIVPFVYAPEVRHAWVFESLNSSEDTMRAGFWMALMVNRGEFAIKRQVYRDRLGLEQLIDMTIDQNGRPVVNPRPTQIDDEAMRSFQQLGSGISGKTRPWVDGGQQTPLTRTTIVMPNGNSMSSVAPATTSPSMPLGPNGQMATAGDVQRILQEAQRQMNAYDAQPTPGQTNATNLQQGLRDAAPGSEKP